MTTVAAVDPSKRIFNPNLLLVICCMAPLITGTPVTTRHFANYGQGEIYGIAATPRRFLTRGLGARTPIRNLYLTGQDAASLGIVGALFGGILSASAVLGKNLVGKVTQE